MSLIRKHGAVLQAWACLDLVFSGYRIVPFAALRCLHLSKIIQFYRCVHLLQAKV